MLARLAPTLLLVALPALGRAQTTAACMPASPAFPRSITCLSGVIGGSGTRYTQGIEASPTSAYAAEASFGGTAASDCDQRILYSHACFWRLSTDARLSQFYDSGSGQGDVRCVLSPTAPAGSWTVLWPDVDDRALLEARWTQVPECRAEGSALITNLWVLENTDMAPHTFEFYAYADVDLGDYRNNATTVPDATTRHVLGDDRTSPTYCDTCVEFHGVTAPDTYVVDFYPNLEVALTSDPFPGLSNTVPPFGPDDYTGAFGWSFTLMPGARTTIRYTIGRNALFCATRGDSAHYGDASSPLMSVTASGRPTLGNPFEVDVTGPASTTAVLFIGAMPRDLALPGCPIRLLVTEFAALSLPLDAAGLHTLELPAPCAPVFCGFKLYLQAWAYDASAACLPLIHSDGLELTYGRS